MSFSMNVKNEIALLESTQLENLSELSAIIRNSAVLDKTIKIMVENNALARRIYLLIKNNYHVRPVVTVRRRFNFRNNLTYILEIKDKFFDILVDLSIVSAEGNFLDIPRDYLLGDDDLKRAYLRGVFLVTGSINDPKTSRYHLEMLVDNNEYVLFLKEILDNYKLNAKVIRREKNYMLYMKEAEKISDFLRIIKAYNAVLYFEDIRIYRDHKNMTNRLNNCEQANMDKVFYTANRQIEDINVIMEMGIFDALDEKLQVVINYRLKYPETSLKELGDIISLETGVKISKSGLNHRFRKIREISIAGKKEEL